MARTLVTKSSTSTNPRYSENNRQILRAAMSRLSPATQVIADHLLAQDSITAVEASALYRTRSLSRRICDLKDLNVDIVSQVRQDHTGQRYVRYVLQ